LPKINIKARLKRQSRILKENKAFWIKRSSLHKNSILTFIFFFLVILFPVYPSIAWYIRWEDEFYRWNIDKDSIIESFDFRNQKDFELFTTWEEDDEDIMVNIPLNEERDTRWDTEIIEHIVEPWESIWSLANKYKISPQSIISLNHLEKIKYLKPGMKIKILPTSWILYKVKSWDTISTIARKYNIDEKKIIEQNFSTWNVLLKAWQEIIIPWWKYIPPKPKIKEEKAKLISQNKKKKELYKKARISWAKLKNARLTWPKLKNTKKTYKKRKTWSTKWYYKLRRHKPYSWAPWNCTRYVASYKNVKWRWNANRWLTNASRAWARVIWWRKIPRPWYIVVFNGRWYNPRYGHVWIVMSVNQKKWTMVVSDMNYAWLRKVTYRTVKLNHRAIRWYIDVWPY
jgi:hypothetical protein